MLGGDGGPPIATGGENGQRQQPDGRLFDFVSFFLRGALGKAEMNRSSKKEYTVMPAVHSKKVRRYTVKNFSPKG
jgi:hypothetical protein